MTRVKKAVNALKRRRSRLFRTKGFRHGRSTKEREAKEAILHAGKHSFAHRRDKKGDFRRMWNVKISYAAKANGTSYSKLMGGLKKNGVLLDRKILAQFAENSPDTFKKIMEMAHSTPKVKTKSTAAVK